MKVLVLGSGGREHALAWAVARSARCTDLIVAPGNAMTPGRRLDIAVNDPEAVCALAKLEEVDLVIIGPDAAIEAGVADALTAAGILAFGATRAAGELEWSKTYSSSFCDRHAIPAPRFAAFGAGDDAVTAACAYVHEAGVPFVVKADGLAAGKGVVVPASVDETIAAIDTMRGTQFVLQELLAGEEVSLLAFCDGTTVVPMPPAQDHKRIGEGDRGPNTGGMGAYAPAPVCPPGLVAELVRDVLEPAVRGSAADGRPYRGVLYAGLMLTADGPKVLEFNCRFGDPEAQVLLPLLASDFLDVAVACATGTLGGLDVRWHEGAACTVVVASGGYPGAVLTGVAVPEAAGQNTPEGRTGVFWPHQSGQPLSLPFFAGVERDGDGRLVTSGGRVVAATGLGSTVREARARAYELAGQLRFDGSQMRRDIGWRAVARSTGGYAASGVSIDEGNRAVELLKDSVATTHRGGSVLAGIGAFGGAFDASALKAMDAPVLVASTDGVGTKVALAAEAGRLDGVGIDLVNHCVNDVLVQNARPLFFLDYIASSTIIAEDVATIVAGMSAACAANDCVLLGGETAEMPGVYHDGHVDIAGTLIGAVDRVAMLPRDGIAVGDVLVGIASSGPHTNGYSLMRRMFAALPFDAMPAPLQRPLVDALLEPHRSYLPVLRALLDGPDAHVVKGLAHITGGGLIENVPRVLPDGVGADIMLGSWPVPPLFQLIRDASGLDAEELHRTLNMGIGMVVVCAPDDVTRVQAAIAEDTWVIGSLVAAPGVHLR
jgi:phosphoribosylamine--glycine ligase/phosphoribosylaminoimidazole synthetase